MAFVTINSKHANMEAIEGRNKKNSVCTIAIEPV